MKTVAEILREGAELHEQRGSVYGKTYVLHGAVAAALFPNGVELKTADDHLRFAMVTMKIGKLTRYCQNFARGGHDDSLNDDMVYTAMLLEQDMEIRENNEETDWSDLREDPSLAEVIEQVSREYSGPAKEEEQ